MKEAIKKFTLMDDGTVYIKTNRRTYQRTFKKCIDDVERIKFQHQEFSKQDMNRYDCEVLF